MKLQFFWLQCALALKAVVENQFIPALPFSHKLYNNEFEFRFSWELLDGGTSLHGQLLLSTQNESASPINGSYVALGFGKGMLQAQFIISTGLFDGAVDVSEYMSLGIYDGPVLLEGSDVKVVPLRGMENATHHYVEFTRTLNDFKNREIVPSATNTLIWAFRPNVKSGTKVLKSHTVEHRGLVKVNFAEGALISDNPISYASKEIHGYGILTVWLGLIPFGMFIARYCRSVSGWLVLKIVNQCVAVVTIFLLFFYVLTTEPVFGTAHSYLGLAVLFISLAQIILGVTSTMGMSNIRLERYRTWSRNFHLLTGWFLFIIGIVACGFGINILSPYRRFKAIWYVFFCTIGFWVLVFLTAELLYRFKYKKTPGYKKVDTEMDTAQKRLQFSNKFTWESINREVSNGRMYVVAHGKYVYDISRWVYSHPGGKIILHACCGTDITNDFFHEAGYDAGEYSPKAIPSRVFKKGSQAGTVQSKADKIALQRGGNLNGINFGITRVGGIQFEKDDWKCIQKARRVHVHTKLAIEKLASLMVGKLIDDSNSGQSVDSSTLKEGQICFSEYEYRRYALTRSEVASATGVTRPFIKLRFCLLYPYDIRAKQPRRFLPGQCVEIEIQIPDGKRISRFYTPISGDLNSFDILIKYVPNGKMSSHLFHSIPGESQYKIRGPFGTPFSPVPYGLRSEQFFDTIYCFAGGSGITPFLQLLNYLIMPLNTPLRVGNRNYTYQAGDLYLDVGDYVEVTHHFMDGYAFGTNMKTGEQGSFDLRCIVPFSQTRIVLFHFADNRLDLMGNDQFQLAESIYPNLVEVVYMTSATLSADKIAMHLDNSSRNIQVIACGPVGLNSRIVEILSGFGGLWIDKLRLMRNNSWS